MAQITLNSSGVASNGTLALQSNGTTTAVTINASQGVEFNAGAVGTPSITTTGDTNTGIFFPAADTIAFSEGGTEAMRIDSSGNVLVNTTNAGVGGLGVSNVKNINFVEDATSAYATLFRQSGSAALTLNYGYAWSNTSSAWASSIGSATARSSIAVGAGFVRFYTDASSTAAVGTDITPTERMRIDSSGNLLVGATATIASHKAVVQTANDGQLLLNATTAGSGVFSTISFANQGTVKTQIFWQSTNSQFHVQNGTGGVSLAQNGTAWTSASDERSKTDLLPIENAAQKVSTLRAVTGRYKTDAEGTSRAFLIAQDIQAVLPEAVDASDPESLGVQYTDVIPLLVAAIKEQQAIITQLQADVAALKGTA